MTGKEPPLPQTDQEFIIDYLKTAASQEEKMALVKEISESFGIPVDEVNKLTGTYGQELNAITPDTTSFQHRPDAEKNKPPSGRKSDQKEKKAALVDYDYQSKIEWREHVLRFIDENTDAAKRPNMKVIGLFGKQCAQVGELIDLGFIPENITAVERDEDVRQEFESNAHKLGIKTISGDLKDVLPEIETPFDINILDFAGQLSRTYIEDILGNLLTSNRTVVVLNLMAKRERRQMQKILKHIDIRHSESAIQTLHQIVDRLKSIHQTATAEELQIMTIKEYTNEYKVELDDARNSSLAKLITMTIGQFRKENLLHSEISHIPICDNIGYKKVEAERCINIKILLWSILDDIEDYWPKLLFHSSQRINFSRARVAIFYALFCRNMLMKADIYKYHSHASTKNSPFITTSVVLQRPREKYIDMRRTTNHFLKIIAYKAEKFRKAGGFEEARKSAGKSLEYGWYDYADRHGRVIKTWEPVTHSSLFRFNTIEHGIISTLPIGRFIDDINRINHELSLDMSHNNHKNLGLEMLK